MEGIGINWPPMLHMDWQVTIRGESKEKLFARNRCQRRFLKTEHNLTMSKEEQWHCRITMCMHVKHERDHQQLERERLGMQYFEGTKLDNDNLFSRSGIHFLGFVIKVHGFMYVHICAWIIKKCIYKYLHTCVCVWERAWLEVWMYEINCVSFLYVCACN